MVCGPLPILGIQPIKINYLTCVELKRTKVEKNEMCLNLNNHILNQKAVCYDSVLCM